MPFILKIWLPLISILLLMSGLTYAAPKGKPGTGTFDDPETLCLNVSSNCQICADTGDKTAAFRHATNGEKIPSLLKCLGETEKKRKRPKNRCIDLSDTCKLCFDEKFYYVKTGELLNTDLAGCYFHEDSPVKKKQ